MIELKITKTFKRFGDNEREDGWRSYDVDIRRFNTIDEAKTWLKDEYGTCKKQKMYRDPTNAHIGYVYCFRNKDEKTYEQHWVEFRIRIEDVYNINPKTGEKI